ncbi:hypothetical protein [Burkholderia cenocepacia]|uniref:hypothetical protein n=1 Tax=Burkholderia cenocepacia TaxID=95486 RepID=UPI000846BBB1|nr:hypothetical protein [Burkholderia cenocepacia]
MAKKSNAAEQFLKELMAFTDDQRRLIDAACDGFAVDEDARLDRRMRVFSGNLSAFLWARRLNSALSARLRESLAKQDSKLVHR